MSSLESFVSDLEGRNQTSFDRLVAGYVQLIATESLSLADLLKLEAKSAVEAIEASAMWLGVIESLDFKLALAAHAGALAERYRMLGERLVALGVTIETFDPLCLGFSKLFAFYRSLQTVEEQAAAGALTSGGYALARFAAVAGRARAEGDAETTVLCEEHLPATERPLIHAGRIALMAKARNEESQARARRSMHRTVELYAEVQEAGYVKKFLARCGKRVAAS
jgi:hypothetical protein